MTCVVAYRENRASRSFELALSCGCNVTLPLTRTLLEFLQALIDLQRDHRCEEA